LTADDGTFTNPTIDFNVSGTVSVTNFIARKAGLAVFACSYRVDAEDPSVQHSAYTLVIAYS
jgi:hypothetical protein